MRKLIKQDIEVLRLLHKGQAHKTSRKYIMAATGLSQRKVYDSIEALRNVGIPVMASRNNRDSGYFIAETAEEKQAGIAQYKRQIATEQHSLSQLERADINGYLPDAAADPVLWAELGSELLDVTPTSDGASIRLKKTL
ncbi:HTH domain-containing protein [Secundilactobacillus muriivasis]